MRHERIYRLTSIARPLDPRYGTNRAVLLALPIAGVIAATAEWLRAPAPAFLDVVGAAALGALTAAGAWALARELAPDDNPAAFASMAAAFVTFLAIPDARVVLLFTALALARIVNRTVGLPARPTDSLAVAALVVASVRLTNDPWLGAVGAVAFALDAVLFRPLPTQWWFAGACLAGTGLLVSFGFADPSAPRLAAGPAAVTVLAVAIVFIAQIAATTRVESTGDVGGEPLSVARVRGGMAVGLAVPAVGLLSGVGGVEQGSLVWATVAGVVMGGVVRAMQQRRPAAR